MTTDDERKQAIDLVDRLCHEVPPRRAGTAAERQAHELVAEALADAGLEPRLEPFRFGDNLYAVLALHFGLGTLGWAVGGRRPLLGATLHALAGGSYWADTERRAEVLRNLLPQRSSQNLVAVLPATGTRRLRIVTLAHIDAAYTGLLFDPRFVRTFTHKGTRAGWAARSLGVATEAELAGAALSLARAGLGGGHRWLRRAEHLAAIPGLLAFLLNGQIVLRDEIVPGAADNLTGVAATVLLAQRLAEVRHPDVEHVLVVTGAEEAGTGGARRLAAARADQWDPADTVVVGLDTLSNGELFWAVEGELRAKSLVPWLDEVLRDVARSDPRFAGVGPFEVPVGATDAMPFTCRGYPATSLVCVDTAQGSPRHYHHPSDTPENLDWDQFALSVDFAEALLRRIAEVRLG